MCRFVLLEVPDITGIPAFTQHSLYGYYTVTHTTMAAHLTVQWIRLPHFHGWCGYILLCHTARVLRVTQCELL